MTVLVTSTGPLTKTPGNLAAQEVFDVEQENNKALKQNEMKPANDLTTPKTY